jgi:hypothetical protein
LGIIAPLGSVTVPTIVASYADARTGKQRRSRERKTVQPDERQTALANKEDKGHILVPPHQTSSDYR